MLLASLLLRSSAFGRVWPRAAGWVLGWPDWAVGRGAAAGRGGLGRKKRSLARKRAPRRPPCSPCSPRASGQRRQSLREREGLAEGPAGPGSAGARRAPSPRGRCARAPVRGGARPQCPARSRPRRVEVVLHLSRREKTGRRGTSRSRSPHRAPSAALEPRTESQRSPEAAGRVPGGGAERAPGDRRARAHNSLGLPGKAAPARVRRRAHSPTRAHCHAHTRARTPARAHRHSHADTRTRGGWPSAALAPSRRA